jgi:tRNA-dihydrouridine synthase
MINDRIYLAPFQGITTYTYREVYTKYFKGVDKLFTPFFTGIQKTKGLSKRAKELNFTHQNGVEVVPQILSKDADEIVRFANFCNEKGYKEINWNLGCPYPRVANKKRGSGMLPYPEMIDEILNQVFQQISINFSVKCRLGYFSEKEIIDLMHIYNKYDICELTIHARIGKQLYKGDVNLEAFVSAMEICNIPLVYNGDIFTVSDISTYKDKFNGISNWMIGRGLLVDPFLPGDIKGIPNSLSDSRVETMYRFLTDLYISYRKVTNDGLQTLSVLKELWGFIAYSFSESQSVFNAVKKVKTFYDYESAVSLIFHDFEWVGANEDLFRKRLSTEQF